jgi:hypothetical protein
MGLFTREPAAPTPMNGSAFHRTLDTTHTRSYGALTASSARIRVTDSTSTERLRRTAQEDSQWQDKAWEAFRTVGEIHFAFTLVSNLIGRMRFFPAAQPETNTSPAFIKDVKDLTPGIAEAALAAIRRITTQDSNLSEIAAQIAINLSIAGECYLVQTPASSYMGDDGVSRDIPEKWEVRAKNEVIVTSPQPTRRRGAQVRSHTIRLRNSPTQPDDEQITLPTTAFVGRIWKRNPQYQNRADSSLRAVLDLVDELMVVNRSFRATATSRLNNGILFIPDGMSAATTPSAPAPEVTTDTEGNPETILPDAPPDDDEFEDALMEGMMTPMVDPGAPAATLPVLVRGPAELGEKIRLINFERTYDPALIQRADRILERILQGLDLPKDIVSGLSNLRYSNAVNIEDTFYKSHIEPMAQLICDTITDVYLRPALEAVGYTREQAGRIRLWYDASSIVARPNRNQDAQAAFDRYALSARSLREAIGFNDSDAPTPSEIVLRMLLQKGPITPELSEALMKTIAPLTMDAAKDAAAEDSENPLPPEVQNLLQGGPAAEPAAPEPEPAAEETLPTPEPQANGGRPPETTPPRGPNPANPASTPQPTRPGEAVELDPGVSLLPPRT